MTAGLSQKMRLIYLARIFEEKTDEHTGISMGEIISTLDEYGMTATRKTIYADLKDLEYLGYHIERVDTKTTHTYHLVSRKFQLAELKLLVDSVQSSRFITERKSSMLIKKIISMASANQAKELKRQVYISGRIKSSNESIFTNVDFIHTAINTNKTIKFQYYKWTSKKKQELRHDGQVYEVSPWALISDNEYYYLLAYDANAGFFKHFRVDKMVKISLTMNKREGRELFADYDMASYTERHFGMFHGEYEVVTLKVANELADVIVDRFGKDVGFMKADEEHFEVRVKVAISEQFFGWLLSFGKGLELTGPDQVRQRLTQYVDTLKEVYGG